MTLKTFQEERDKAARALELVEAELHANEADARIAGFASKARLRFFELRDVVLKEQAAELKKQIASLDARIKWERSVG